MNDRIHALARLTAIEVIHAVWPTMIGPNEDVAVALRRHLEIQRQMVDRVTPIIATALVSMSNDGDAA